MDRRGEESGARHSSLRGIISLYFAPETYKRDLYAEARTEAAEAKKSQPASSR
jgi:hypothetical protein